MNSFVNAEIVVELSFCQKKCVSNLTIQISEEKRKNSLRKKCNFKS